MKTLSFIDNLKDIDTLEQDISKRYLVSDMIKTHGLTQTSFALLSTTHLLTGSAYSALEHLTVDQVKASTPTALEALEADGKEKAAHWSAKIISFFKDGSQTIIERIQALWEATKEKAKLVLDKGIDGAKATTALIEAHPYKTIALVLAAAGAAFGIMTFVGTSLPVGVVTNGQMHAFMLRLKTMYHSVKWPFGKITTSAVSDGRLIFATVETTKKATVPLSARALGWTEATVKSVFTQIDKIGEGTIKGLTFLWNKILKPAEKVVAGVMFAPKDAKDFIVKKTDMRTLGWAAEKITSALYYSILYKLMNNLYHFIKVIIVDAFEAVKDCFNKLKTVTA